ncbi:short-chain collagen C4-like [Liolophura sinensis]|uniref:short-chain collagen C4-like n=1 Tax=Liolophura sinensis TaxID=3198878 RepID=UPI003158BDEB
MDETESRGVVYTRWGRNICPDHSQRLYSGIMAGSYYKHTGSGANQLCLPLDPQFNKTYPGHQSKSYVYGTEFQISSGNDVFYTTNSGGVVPHDREAQCAVCYTSGRLSHLMIPARLECPSGWTVEYLGFLMSQHHTYHKSEYVCVDQDPDTHPATASNLNGNLLYVVEAACGSLPCPPYVDGYEITCVVCTK